MGDKSLVVIQYRQLRGLMCQDGSPIGAATKRHTRGRVPAKKKTDGSDRRSTMWRRWAQPDEGVVIWDLWRTRGKRKANLRVSVPLGVIAVHGWAYCARLLADARTEIRKGM